MDKQSLLPPKVRGALADADVKYEVLPCDASFADTASFCLKYGFTAQQSANTILVVNRREPSHLVACVVLANSKLDVNKTVCKLMGAKRVSFAPAEQTLEVTGMEIGGVTIFGLPAGIPVYVDAAVMDQPEVVVGGGNRTSKVVLAPAELTKLPKVAVVEGLGLSSKG